MSRSCPDALETHLTTNTSLLVASACLDGLLVVASRSQLRSDVPLIVLAADGDPHIEADLLRAGARAVLPVTVDRDSLLRAADDALAGRSTASAEAIRLLSQTRRDPPTLTGRQRQILEALASGDSTREIAEKLFVTQSTVKTHVGRLAARLNLAGRHELVEMAPRILAHCAGPDRKN